MTSAMTRRTALTTLGTGSIAALTACSASLTTANTAGTHDSNGTSVVNNNSKAKASERSDYSGAVEFNSYDTSAGQYKPATRTSPPQNVPKPIKPENMDEHSVAGLYSAIGYLSAATSYAFVTSDLGPLDHLPFSDTYTNTFKKQIRETTQEMDGAWFEELKIAFTLNTAQPTQDGDNYKWPAKFIFSMGSFVVYRGIPVDLPSDKQSSSQEATFTAQYKDGRWILSETNDSSGGSFGPSGGNFKI